MPYAPNVAADDALEVALGRLAEARALVQTIQDHDLLAELPAREAARADHQRAVSLIAVLHRELQGLSADLEAAIATRDVLSRARNGPG